MSSLLINKHLLHEVKKKKDIRNHNKVKTNNSFISKNIKKWGKLQGSGTNGFQSRLKPTKSLKIQNISLSSLLSSLLLTNIYSGQIQCL